MYNDTHKRYIRKLSSSINNKTTNNDRPFLLQHRIETKTVPLKRGKYVQEYLMVILPSFFLVLFIYVLFNYALTAMTTLRWKVG